MVPSEAVRKGAVPGLPPLLEHGHPRGHVAVFLPERMSASKRPLFIRTRVLLN